jgi:hypothetical protein
MNDTEDTIVLFRPVDEKELALIRESGNRAFPPRLPEQPIFYPVVQEDYAVQIARDWMLATAVMVTSPASECAGASWNATCSRPSALPSDRPRCQDRDRHHRRVS